MKRSRHIHLVLIGSLSAGSLAGCHRAPSSSSVGSAVTTATATTAANVYTNNQYVPGVGYYHAPFRAWFEFPYNHYDAQNQRYYYGGTWAAAPHQSITNISAPLPRLAHLAEPQPAPVTRRGFGSTAHRHSIWA